MKEINQAFRGRVYNSWKFQWRVWKMAVDWTVALYIVIPLLGFLGYHYWQWWTSPVQWTTGLYSLLEGMEGIDPPLSENTVHSMVEAIQHFILFIILFLFSWSGKVRYYIEAADSLFIYQHQTWFLGMMRRGTVISFVLQILKTVLLFLILYPLWRMEVSWGFMIWVLLFLFTFGFKMNAAMFQQLLGLGLSGWRHRLASMVSFLIGGILFIVLGYYGVELSFPLLGLGSLIVGLSFILAWQIRRRMNRRGAFYTDVEREQRYQWRFAAILLGQVLERKRAKPRRKPLLWRRSQLLFQQRNQVNAFVEAGIKSFFRNRMQWFTYLRVLALFTVILVVLPTLIKLLAGILGGVILSYWLRMMSKELEGAPFLRLFNWAEDSLPAARGRLIFILLLPGMAWIGAVTGWFMLAGWGAGIGLLCGIALSKLLASLHQF